MRILFLIKEQFLDIVVPSNKLLVFICNATLKQNLDPCTIKLG